MDIKLIHERTAYTTTYREGNKFTSVVSMYPVNYQDEKGDWSEIDLSINEIDQWEFTDANQTHVLRSYFGDTTSDNRHLVSVETLKEDGRQLWVNFKLLGANPKYTMSRKNSFKFIDCFDGIDVEYIISNEVLKENIILKRETDMREFVFTLKMGNVLAVNDNGLICFVDDQSNELAFSLVPPFMFDADGKRSEKVSYSLTEIDGFQSIVVTVDDEDFLSNAVHPVIIDPPIMYDNADTKVFQDHGTNVPTPTFTAFSNSNDSRESALYLKYLDTLKDSNPKRLINKIAVSLYVTAGGGGSGCYIFGISNSNWTNSSISSGTKPIKGSLYRQLTPSVLKVGQWTEVNITSNFSSTFNGIMFSGNYPNDINCNVTFASPYYADTTKRPILTVEYILRPALAFHDGTSEGGFYADSQGNIFKYLEMGNIVASQETVAYKVFLKNESGAAVKNLKIFLPIQEFAPDVNAFLSTSNNPFIGEKEININGTIQDKDSVSFYVRVSSGEKATYGGEINIMAKCDYA